MKNLVLLIILVLNTSCAVLMKSNVVTPKDENNQFINSNKCLGYIGEDDTRKMLILPQPNGYIKMVGPLFIPLIPVSLTWNDSIESLYFHVLMMDYKNKKTASMAADEAIQNNNWVIKVNDFEIPATSIQPKIYPDKQHYLEIKFMFPQQVVKEYSLIYSPEKLVLNYRHKLKWSYRVFTIDPRLADQCEHPPIK